MKLFVVGNKFTLANIDQNELFSEFAACDYDAEYAAFTNIEDAKRWAADVEEASVENAYAVYETEVQASKAGNGFKGIQKKDLTLINDEIISKETARALTPAKLVGIQIIRAFVGEQQFEAPVANDAVVDQVVNVEAVNQEPANEAPVNEEPAYKIPVVSVSEESDSEEPVNETRINEAPVANEAQVNQEPVNNNNNEEPANEEPVDSAKPSFSFKSFLNAKVAAAIAYPAAVAALVATNAIPALATFAASYGVTVPALLTSSITLPVVGAAAGLVAGGFVAAYGLTLAASAIAAKASAIYADYKMTPKERYKKAKLMLNNAEKELVQESVVDLDFIAALKKFEKEVPKVEFDEKGAVKDLPEMSKLNVIQFEAEAYKRLNGTAADKRDEVKQSILDEAKAKFKAN